MKTLYYQIDVRNQDTGFWSRRAKFSPPYEITRTFQLHKFFFFTWETSTTKCLNKREADIEARVEAIRFARELTCLHNVRVCKLEEFRSYGAKVSILVPIWEDGKFKDC